jgi:hypothetical protein
MEVKEMKNKDVLLRVALGILVLVLGISLYYINK